MQRQFPRTIKRIVIKVGSSVIATYKMKPRSARLKSLVEQICLLRSKGIDVVLVSSGAIILGLGELKEKFRPSDLASLQAIAAVGQAVLMRLYNDFFANFRIKCAQVLLTWDDFDNRQRYNNARGTFNAIFERGVVPVVNENDTISTDEIKFGDNDKLSALVASLIHADLLLILSDVDGLYDLNKKVLSEIKEIGPEIESIATGTNNKQMSKGGMSAKLEAVKMATHFNIPCIIANGETKDVLTRILNGERIGTFFVEKSEKTLAWKHWISFGAKPKGIIFVDDGAKNALLEGNRSLLLPGVIKWEGNFKQDDVVIVCDKDRQEIARGVSEYSLAELLQVTDKKGKKEFIHRNNLILCRR